MSLESPQKTQNGGCGCTARPRRLCDVCEAEGRSFFACSLACLEVHLSAAHPELGPSDSFTRACGWVREQNRRLPDCWATYASHRRELGERLDRLPPGGDLCVFGAGNADDLELERLTERFAEVHLVDLDGEALEAARQRLGSAARAKVVLHPEVDCSGLLEHLDDWAERFPEPDELMPAAVFAAQGIVRGLGRGFSAVVSTCVLSQLPLPFQRAWLTSRANWGALLRAIGAVHLATLAGSLRSGGRGLLVVDTASSRDSPALAEQKGRSPEELEEFVAEARASHGLALRPDPEDLLRQFASPGLDALLARPHLSSPWLWELGAETRLVYALGFEHPLG